MAGDVKTQFYPSGHSVIYNYDVAGRIGDNGAQMAFTGNLGDGAARTYSSGVTYDESGGLRQEKFGTQIPLYHKLHYNVRGQLFDIRLSTVAWDADQWNWNRGAILNYYSSNYAWEGDPNTPAGPDNNGNLRRQQHWVPADDAVSSYTYTQDTYEYDQLNRLTSAAEVHGSPSGQSGQDYAQVFDYDRWGNRTINLSQSQNVPATQYDFDKGDLQNTNRLYAPGDAGLPMSQRRMRYDAAGNLTYDFYAGAGSRTYDAENRMVSAQTSVSQSAVNTYDDDGRRVKRNTGTGEVWQVYGADGELLAEYDAYASPNFPQKEYGYRGGELLVTATAPTAGWGPVPALDDNPLNPNHSGETPIRSVHITQLRTAIDSLRSHLGLGGYPWSAPAGVGDPVSIDPIVEMRTALDQALGAPSGGYTPGLASKQPVLAAHIQELRRRVLNAWQSSGSSVDIRWLAADQLGTPRMVADQTGSLGGVSRHDYLPFGEELYAGAGGRTTAQGYRSSDNDNLRQKFTSYERDAATALDFAQARYFASNQGRFTSPDPFMAGASIGNPQSFNRYAYALNSPVNLVDPSGLSASNCSAQYTYKQCGGDAAVRDGSFGDDVAATYDLRGYSAAQRQQILNYEYRVNNAGYGLQASGSNDFDIYYWIYDDGSYDTDFHVFWDVSSYNPAWELAQEVNRRPIAGTFGVLYGGSVAAGASAGALVYYAPAAFTASNAAFWTGVRPAVARAVSNQLGYRVLSQTVGGRAATLASPVVSILSRPAAQRMWSYASEQFAKNADRALIITGDIVREGATLVQNEAPIIYERAIETRVIFYRGP